MPSARHNLQPVTGDLIARTAEQNTTVDGEALADVNAIAG
jgi:hypothetical protein